MWFQFKHYPDVYESWWGITTLPCVDKMNESYIRYIIEDEDSVLAHWLRLGADGYRLDVVDELPDAFLARLRKRLRELKPDAPIYMMPGDKDPLPASMSYATGGSPFAPWVLGAKQRGQSTRCTRSRRLPGYALSSSSQSGHGHDAGSV